MRETQGKNTRKSLVGCVYTAEPEDRDVEKNSQTPNFFQKQISDDEKKSDQKVNNAKNIEYYGSDNRAEEESVQ